MYLTTFAILLGIGLVGTIGVLGGVPNTLSWVAYHIYRASQIQRARANKIASQLNEQWMRKLENSIPETSVPDFDTRMVNYLKEPLT